MRPSAPAPEQLLDQPDPALSTGSWKGKAQELFQRLKSKELQNNVARPFDPKAENIEAEVARCVMSQALWSVWDNQVLLQLMHAGLVFCGASNEADMILNLYPLYQALMQRTSATDRMGLYSAVRSEIVGEYPVTCNALMPFFIVEDDSEIVSTAVLDYVLLRPAVGGDTMVGVREIMRWLEQDIAANRGATLGGWVTVGDRRIHEILEAKWSMIASDDISVIAHLRTDFPNVSTCEFWLRWMEHVIEVRDDALFGHVARGLGLLLKGMSSPGFV